MGRGLVLYLKELEEQLNQITDDKELQLYIFQIVSELGSLVFPNTSACYSIIPGDLKSIDWEQELKKKKNINIVKDYPKIQQLINKFENAEQNKTLVCLISICLCELIVFTDDKMNGLLVNELGEYLNTEEQERPRLKVSIWLPRLTYVIHKHLEGLFKIVDDEKVNLEINLQI